MRLFILALCLVSTTSSCFSSQTEKEKSGDEEIIGILYTDPIYCPPCQFLDEELADRPELSQKITVKKIKLLPNRFYPDDYPDNPWPSDIEGIPILRLNNGVDVIGPHNILEKLKGPESHDSLSRLPDMSKKKG